LIFLLFSSFQKTKKRKNEKTKKQQSKAKQSKAKQIKNQKSKKQKGSKAPSQIHRIEPNRARASFPNPSLLQ